MSDRYFNCDVNREMCQEYLDLTHSPKTPRSAVAANKRKQEIREYLAFEVISKYADKFAPEDPLLEVVQ